MRAWAPVISMVDLSVLLGCGWWSVRCFVASLPAGRWYRPRKCKRPPGWEVEQRAGMWAR